MGFPAMISEPGRSIDHSMKPHPAPRRRRCLHRPLPPGAARIRNTEAALRQIEATPAFRRMIVDNGVASLSLGRISQPSPPAPVTV